MSTLRWPFTLSIGPIPALHLTAHPPGTQPQQPPMCHRHTVTPDRKASSLNGATKGRITKMKNKMTPIAAFQPYRTA